MPYVLVSSGGKYAVKTKTTGRTHGWTTKPRAEAQMRLLESIVKKGGK